TYNGNYVTNAARSIGVNGTVVNGGICDSVGAWGGAVVLCQRGTIGFVDKVRNVQSGGGKAAVIYNNVPGGFFGTLGDGNTSTIPAISISQEDGQAALGQVNASGTVVSRVEQPASGYSYFDGTSMATPHVSAIAALVWSYNPAWTNVQIRNALNATAKDKGTAGRDNSYGYGIAQTKAALDYLQGGGPTGTTPSAPSGLTATAASKSQINLSWTDNSSNEDGFKIERCLGSNCTNFAQVATVGVNIKTFSDTGLSGNKTYSYRVRAYNGTGDSAHSNVANATTPRK
ncbi:MAG TPA: S8 family serine peptidase, partial [Pyrinomonadaceae bacterium]|nr:S8 family serine peptidase [Pyrinomonadaceae bacterium]